MKKWKIALIFLVVMLTIMIIFFVYKSNEKILYAPIDSQYKIIEKVDENGNEIIDTDKYSELILIIYNNKHYLLKNSNGILEKGKYIYNDDNIRFISNKEYVSIWNCNLLTNNELSNCDKYSNNFYIKK